MDSNLFPLRELRDRCRRCLPHEVPEWVRPGSVFFITVCCAERQRNQLCTDSVAAAIFESVEFRQSRGDWHVRLMVLMPDHLHALISFPHSVAMRTVIAQWKQIVAKRTGVHWQRDFFDHRLRGGDSIDEKAHYIRMNPVRKGLVRDVTDWPYLWEDRRPCDR